MDSIYSAQYIFWLQFFYNKIEGVRYQPIYRYQIYSALKYHYQNPSLIFKCWDNQSCIATALNGVLDGLYYGIYANEKH